MAQSKQPPQVITAFVVLGVAIIALFAYAMSLRSDNAALREELAAHEGDGELIPEAEDAAGSEDVDEIVAEPDRIPPDEANPPAEGVAVGDFALGPSERATLSSQLGFISPDVDRRVWLTVTFGDPAAARFASALGEVFTDAGFDVQPTVVARFPIRPGIYFMSADEEPPEHVNAILAALEATGYDVTSGRGYRDFYRERKREDPEWNGFDMTDDQPFVIAIGRSGQ